jgi:plasmid stabilization system protein ParE
MQNAIFELIFDHLFDTYVDLGDPPDEALERSAERIRKLRLQFDRLVDTPYIGPLRADIHSGIPILLRDKMAIWFLPVDATYWVFPASGPGGGGA